VPAGGPGTVVASWGEARVYSDGEGWSGMKKKAKENLDRILEKLIKGYSP